MNPVEAALLLTAFPLGGIAQHMGLYNLEQSAGGDNDVSS